jgi:hypothetical protein
MSMSRLSRRVEALHKHMRATPVRTWAFILLGALTDITEEDRARIRPGDTVYIKRIILTHE